MSLYDKPIDLIEFLMRCDGLCLTFVLGICVSFGGCLITDLGMQTTDLASPFRYEVWSTDSAPCESKRRDVRLVMVYNRLTCLSIYYPFICASIMTHTRGGQKGGGGGGGPAGGGPA